MDAQVKIQTLDEFLSCRSWLTGVSRLPVRMEVSADRAALGTAASVRQAGLVYTVTSPAFLVRWPPNSKVGFFVYKKTSLPLTTYWRGCSEFNQSAVMFASPTFRCRGSAAVS